MSTYTLTFLPISVLGADAKLLDGTAKPSNGGNEADHTSLLSGNTLRLNDVIHTGSYDDSAYIDAHVLDADPVLHDHPIDAAGEFVMDAQKLTEPVTVGGKTFAAGTPIHTGYRLDLDGDGDGVADLQVWTINIGFFGAFTPVGLASTQRIEPGTAYRIVGGGNENGVTPGAADILDPSALYCFAAGTGIDTPTGERVVEDLAIGDLVRTADGRDVPVTWIGRQRVHKAFTPRARFQPVRVRAGALGGGLPRRDLVLTCDHALILDGLAINAGALVNGDGIAVVPAHELPDQVIYYHVETEGHEVVLANGAPAETYLDQGDRRKFDNYAEYVALYGDDRRIAEMPLPRISAARLVPPALRARLAGRAAA